MTVSFKQFSTFIDASSTAETPEQLDEIFGKIFGRAEDKEGKQNRMMNAKQKMQDRKDGHAARKSALQQKRDEEWAKAKERTERVRGTTQNSRDDYAMHRSDLSTAKRYGSARMQEGVRETFASDLDSDERAGLATVEKYLKAKIGAVSLAQALEATSECFPQGKIGGDAARYRTFVADLRRAYKNNKIHEARTPYDSLDDWKAGAKAAGHKVKKLAGNAEDGDQKYGAFNDADEKMGECDEQGRGYLHEAPDFPAGGTPGDFAGSKARGLKPKRGKNDYDDSDDDEVNKTHRRAKVKKD